MFFLQNKQLFIGFIIIIIGIVLNEWVLASIFSEDGVISFSAKLIILAFNCICVMLGTTYVISVRFRNFILDLIKDELLNLFETRKVFVKTTFVLFISLLLISQFSNMVVNISKVQSNKGIIFATDWDAAFAIETATMTKWYNTNFTNTWGGIIYGPLYYRLAHTIQRFSPISNNFTSNKEINEEKHHFALLLISLISLYGIAILLSVMVTHDLRFRLLSVLLIMASLLNNKTWSLLIFRAHPDLLLCFLIALFLFLIYKSKTKLNKNYFYLAAFVGGAALSTKLIFVYFLPGLIIMEMPPFNRQNIVKLLKLYCLIAIFYFIIGFPQNFRIDLSIGLLSVIYRFFNVTNWNFSIEMCSQIVYQSWRPFLIISFLYLCFGPANDLKKKKKYKHLLTRILIVAFSPLIFLLSKSLLLNREHYTLPFIAILLVAYVVFFDLQSLNWLIKIKNGLTFDSVRYVLSLSLIVLTEMIFGLIPDNVEITKKSVIGPRNQIVESYLMVNKYLDKGKRAFLDSYVPYDSKYNHVRTNWVPTIKVLSDWNPDLLIFNKRSYTRWTEGESPSKYNTTTFKFENNWDEVREFYNIFKNKSVSIDVFGNKWKKVHENNFGIEIWNKQ